LVRLNPCCPLSIWLPFKLDNDQSELLEHEIKKTSADQENMLSLYLAQPNHLPLLYPHCSTSATNYHTEWRTGKSKPIL
jgi:hypothetical protein